MANLKTFLQKVQGCIMTNLTDAGGVADDSNIFMLKQTFAAEFRKVPVLKDSVHRRERSALSSRYHAFTWQWRTANQVLENMLEHSQAQPVARKLQSYSNGNVGVAAIEPGGTAPEDEVESYAVVNTGKDLKTHPRRRMGKAERERHKDTAVPRGCQGRPLPLP